MTEKDTLRILVSWACNLRCSYCCNEQPRFREQFKSVVLSDIDFSQYKRICISGGEPLLYPDRIRAIAECIRKDQIVILYTNGLRLTPQKAQQLDSWGIQFINVGLHLPSAFEAQISACKKAVEHTSIGLRFHVRDIYADALKSRYADVQFQFWKLNDCDRANEERLIVTEWSTERRAI